MNTVDFAAQELGISSEGLHEALRRGRIRAEREARSRNDGRQVYQPITERFALFQAVRDGLVSPIVFHL